VIDVAAVADGYAALSLIRSGLARGLSAGCHIHASRRRWFPRRAVRLLRAEPYEVSLTPTPRFPGTRLLGVATPTK
jgi:phage head maturation protease